MALNLLWRLFWKTYKPTYRITKRQEQTMRPHENYFGRIDCPRRSADHPIPDIEKPGPQGRLLANFGGTRNFRTLPFVSWSSHPTNYDLSHFKSLIILAFPSPNDTSIDTATSSLTPCFPNIFSMSFAASKLSILRSARFVIFSVYRAKVGQVSYIFMVFESETNDFFNSSNCWDTWRTMVIHQGRKSSAAKNGHIQTQDNVSCRPLVLP